jgi:hypothetical protein
VPNEIENSRDQKIETAGRSYLHNIGFKPNRTDVSNGIYSYVGLIVLARKVQVYQFGKFFDEDGYLGDDLIDAMYQVLNEPSWHSVKLLRISIDALVSHNLYHSQLGYFENTDKKLLGFVIQENPFTKSHFAWRRFRESNSLGATGLGLLEALRLVGTSGVHVTTLMFDLCHLLIQKEAASSKDLKIQHGDLRHAIRRIPGEVLPHKVCDLSSEKPYLLLEETKSDLNKIFGFQLSLQCKPERLLLINNSQSNYKLSLDFKVSNLTIGSPGNWSWLGKNQFFAITDDNVLTLESPASIRILSTKFQTDQNNYFRSEQDQKLSSSQTEQDLDKKTYGIANFAFFQAYKGDDNFVKTPPEIYFSFGLEESLFNHLVDELKKGTVDQIDLQTYFKFDSALTTTSKYEGFASEVIFTEAITAEGGIEEFSIEYRIK